MLNNIPVVTKNILIINILIYVVTMVNHQMGGGLHDILAAHFINSPLFQPYQVVTHMFSHSINSIGHIFFNMFALVVFGSHLEKIWGPKRYFIFYFAAGVGAFLLYNTLGFFPIAELKQQLTEMGNNIYSIDEVIRDGRLFEYLRNGEIAEVKGNASQAQFYYDQANNYYNQLINNRKIVADTDVSVLRDYLAIANSGMVGASGAIFGLLAAFALLFPNTELLLLFLPFPIKAKYLIGGYIAYEIYMSFFSTQIDNIAHLAHVGGAVVGLILVLYWRKTDRKNFY